MSKHSQSDSRNTTRKGQKMDNFEDRARKQKMKPIKKEKYRSGGRQEFEDYED